MSPIFWSQIQECVFFLTIVHLLFLPKHLNATPTAFPTQYLQRTFLDQTDPSSSQSSQFGILRCTKRQHPLLQINVQKGIEHKMHSTEDYYIHLLLIFYKEIHLIIGTCDWLSITNIKCINLQFFLHLIKVATQYML